MSNVKVLATKDYVSAYVAAHGGGSGESSGSATSLIDKITATAGQIVKVAEVDENGHPIAWEAVDFPEIVTLPEGGGVGQVLAMGESGTLVWSSYNLLSEVPLESAEEGLF